MPLSRPSQPAPPVITTPYSTPAQSGKRSGSSLKMKKLREDVKGEIEGEDVEVEMDGSVTLVTPPSSSALETLSFASFRFDDEDQQSQTTTQERGRSYAYRLYGRRNGSSSPSSVEEEGEGDEEETSGAKTLSPPPPQLRKPIILPGAGTPNTTTRAPGAISTTAARAPGGALKKKARFTIGGGDADSCASSYSSSSSSSSHPFPSRSPSRSRFQASASPFSEGDEDRDRCYSKDSGLGFTSGWNENFARPAASTSASRDRRTPERDQGRRSQVYSLEDLLAATSAQSRFSDDSDEGEDDDHGVEEQVEEGERECDLWQRRGRAPRYAVAPAPPAYAPLPHHHHYYAH